MTVQKYLFRSENADCSGAFSVVSDAMDAPCVEMEKAMRNREPCEEADSQRQTPGLRIYHCVSLSLRLLVYLSLLLVCLFICLFVCLSVCLFACIRLVSSSLYVSSNRVIQVVGPLSGSF